MEDFGTADVAGVRIDEKEWLDLGNTSDDTSDRDQLSEVSATDGTDSHWLVCIKRLEVESVSTKENGWKYISVFLVGVLRVDSARVPLLSLVSDDIKNVVFVANVLVRVGHLLVDALGEEVKVALGVIADGSNEALARLAVGGVDVLRGQVVKVSVYKQEWSTAAVAYLCYIIEINDKRLLLPVGNALELEHVDGKVTRGS